MKIFFRRIHLYLSLAAGIVIFIACLTGAILVFEKEIEEAVYSHRYQIEKGAEPKDLHALETSLKAAIPSSSINYFRVSSDAGRTTLLGYTVKEQKKKSDQKKSVTPQKTRPNVLRAYMNPYTGELIDTVNYRETFFFQVFSLHRWLLSGDTGKMIVGIATFIFLFIILTGIILWWPKTRNILYQRLFVKWSAQRKRLNHDLHIVLGFYACIFLFVFSFTGLAWSFEWFNKGIFAVTKSTMEQVSAPKSDTTSTGITQYKYDLVLKHIQERVPNAEYYQISTVKDSLATIQVSVLSSDAAHENANDQYYYDQYTLEPKGQLLFEERNLGQRVRTTFRPVHTGSIFGNSSKIIAFIACIIGASLPVTGSIMWIQRLRKKNKY